MGGKILSLLRESLEDPADQQNEIEEESEIVEEVISIKDSLANLEEKSESALLELLKTLETMDLSAEIVKATGIAKAVKCLQKHPSKRIKHLSKFLIYGWKVLQDECVNTKSNSEENILKAANQCMVLYDPVLLPTDGCFIEESFDNVCAVKDLPSCQDGSSVSASLTLASLVSWEEEDLSKKVSDLPFEAKLEKSRKRLQEAYQEQANAKKQRCVKLIDVKDLPKRENLQEQRKLDGRCRPKKWSNLHTHNAHRLSHGVQLR